MSTQHTQEPWRIESNPDTYTDGVHICGDANDTTNGAGICGLWIDTELSNEEQEANARRIVACVNACAGIPTEVLENIGAGMGPNWLQTKQERDALKIENDEMRRLLMRALYHHQGGSSPIGQPIRRFFGIGQFDELTAEQKEPSRLMLDGHPLDVYGKPCSEWPACGCPRYCSIPF